MYFPFPREMFLVEELDQSLRLVDVDPRTEDWEHIYNDVIEGTLYLTELPFTGYFFASENYIDMEDPCFEVVDGIPTQGNSYFNSFIATDIRDKWENIKLSMDKYIHKHKEIAYYYEDTSKINILLNSVGCARLILYSDIIFLVEMAENNLPIKALPVLRVEGNFDSPTS